MAGPVTTAKMCVGPPVLALIVASIVVGCPAEAPEPYRSLLQLPSPLIEDTITTLPEGEQLALFIYGMTTIHPPRLQLGYRIAERGAYIVPHVVAAVDSVPGDWAKRHLVWVLALIACNENVDLSEEEAVLGTVRGAVRALRSDAAKEDAERFVRAIEGDCGGLP